MALQQTPGNSNASNLPVNQGVLVALASEIYQSLEADKQALDTLAILLTDERTMLESRDHSSIAEFTDRKSLLVQGMEQRNSVRVGLLNQQQMSTEGDHWIKAIELLANAAKLPLISLWNDIETQLVSCNKQLMINERIVGGMKNSVGRFLNILRGQTGTGQTYDATGKAKNFSDHSPITSA